MQIQLQSERSYLAIKSDITDLRSEMRTEMSGLRSQMQTEISGLRSEMHKETGGIRSELGTYAPAVLDHLWRLTVLPSSACLS